MSPVKASAALAGWVADYDRQGWHRTGSLVDAACSRWLATEVEGAGGWAVVDPVPMQRLAHRRSWLGLPAGEVSAVALFDAPVPASGEVAGSLGPLGSAAAIGVVELGPSAVDASYDEARRRQVHQAIVVLSRPSGRGGLALRNAPSASEPFGPPVIQVSSRHRSRVWRAVDERERAVVGVDASWRAAEASNVRAGRGDPEARQATVVLTPKSGWWSCAAERGGGLACWLAALAGAGAQIHLLATTGHELGYLGLRRHLTERPGWDGDAVWVHLGANIGAAGGTLGLSASDDRLLGLASDAFGSGARVLPAPVGEATVLAEAGRPFVSVVGTNARFHRASDRWPENVDVAALAAAADAIGRLLDRLAR